MTRLLLARCAFVALLAILALALAAPARAQTAPLGSIVAWGYNAYGQTTVPALPAGLIQLQVAGGGFHSVALYSDGSVVAWGSNADGQTTVPALPAGLTYTQVAGGGSHTVALRSDGTTVACGDNSWGFTHSCG